MINYLSFTKSISAVINIIIKEKMIKAIALKVPDHPSAIPEKMAEMRAVPAATTQIFSWQVSMNDCKNPLATG